MSVVDRGYHYIRNGAGVERLYDFRTDPFEQVNLAETPSGNDKLPVFRRKLLDVLSDGPGAVEVEKAYLADFRKRVEQLVPQRILARRPRWAIDTARPLAILTRSVSEGFN